MSTSPLTPENERERTVRAYEVLTEAVAHTLEEALACLDATDQAHLDLATYLMGALPFFANLYHYYPEFMDYLARASGTVATEGVPLYETVRNLQLVLENSLDKEDFALAILPARDLSDAFIHEAERRGFVL